MNKKQKFKYLFLYVKNHYYVTSKKQRKLRLGIPSDDFIVFFFKDMADEWKYKGLGNPKQFGQSDGTALIQRQV